jgi:hypothetical protein
MPFTVRETDLSTYQNDREHWREVYQGLIVPAINQSGCRALRDDDDYSARLVAEGVWSKIEQADLVLCDMSSHNPNVHLELGWAMRADKKIVLIKDDVTSFNFDLNQYYTFEYSSRLQPTALQNSVKELSKIIEATLADSVSNYSMVAKLALRQRAVEAASGGNLEVELLQEVLGEVRLLKRQRNKGAFPIEEVQRAFLEVPDPSELPERLIGTTWRKRNGLEEILFLSEDTFAYCSVGIQQWLLNDVSFDTTSGTMELTWRHDGYLAHCHFDTGHSYFTESNGETWFLIAKKPFIHPSFGTSLTPACDRLKALCPSMTPSFTKSDGKQPKPNKSLHKKKPS